MYYEIDYTKHIVNKPKCKCGCTTIIAQNTKQFGLSHLKKRELTRYYVVMCQHCGRRGSRFGDTPTEAVSLWERGYVQDVRKQEIEFDCVNTKGPKTSLKSPEYYSEYYKRLEEEHGVEDARNIIYRDHAVNKFTIYGCHYGSALTPHYINKMDTWYSEEIKKLGTEDERYNDVQLKNFILRNIHLHPILKSNLIQNLKAAKQLA